MEFAHGQSVLVLRRLPGGAFNQGTTVEGCAVAPRTQGESPVPSWPPLTSGREVYAPTGTVVSSRDRMVVDGVTYEVDGDPEDWRNPFTGTAFGVRIFLRRADNWYDAEVVVRPYLGSSGMGSTWGDEVTWPANLVAVSSLNATSTGDEAGAKVTVRVPPTSGGADAVEVFTPGSALTVAGTTATVVSTAPITRDGATEYVEVTAL